MPRKPSAPAVSHRSRAAHMQVKAAGTLLVALEAMYEGRSRKDLRRLLREERVLLNGAVSTDPRRAVTAGDRLECRRFGRAQGLHPLLRVIYEDHEFIVVEKSAGILTAGGAKGGQPSVLGILRRELERRGVHARPWPCHRLDRSVSGILLFAKSLRLAKAVRADPQRFLAERVYCAVVEGRPEPAAGEIRSFLLDGPDLVVRPVKEEEGGKLSICRYRTVRGGERWSELEVRLETGRKNQIRAQLRQIGHPIAGDRKYGARSDPFDRIALHACRLKVLNPVSGETLEFHSAPPWPARLALAPEAVRPR